MTSHIPFDELEIRAAEQRRQIHATVTELRETVKERLDLKRNVRERLGPATGIMVLLGLVLGFAVAGVFTRD
jgi:hypothetical protein